LITPDTSTLIAFFAGEDARDTDALDISLRDNTAVLTPPVLSEILSDPKLPKELANTILRLPRVEIKNEFCLRVANLRRKVLAKKRKARLADSLIAQVCIDHNLLLITRDKDFNNFKKLSSLKIF